MKRVLIILGLVGCYPFVAAGSCATTQGPEPVIVTKEVKIPVVQPCPDKRGEPPKFVDDLDSIKQALGLGTDKAFAVVLAGREQRIQWQQASDAQIAACARKPDG